MRQQGCREDSWAWVRTKIISDAHYSFSIELLFMGPYRHGPWVSALCMRCVFRLRKRHELGLPIYCSFLWSKACLLCLSENASSKSDIEIFFCGLQISSHLPSAMLLTSVTRRKNQLATASWIFGLQS